jgi:hypothetical protein
VDESIVLVRLLLMADRDIKREALGVSGGEKGRGTRRSMSVEAGVLGRGFSRLRVPVLVTCFTCGGCAGVPPRSGGVAVGRSPVCRSFGWCGGPEMAPRFVMPLRTP